MLSKNLDAPMLKTVQDVVASNRISMSEEEAVILFPKIEAFVQEHGRQPNLHSADPVEARYAEALAYLRRRKQQAQTGAGGHG